MKFWTVLVFTLFFVLPASAYVNTPPGTGTAVVRDTSVTNIPIAYGSTGAQLLSGLGGKKHVALYNGSAVIILISTGTTTTNCTGGSDNAFVPPSGTATLEDLKINTVVCARAYGNTPISSGLVAIDAW